MSCSTDIGLQALKALENNVKGQLAGLTAGAGGLTGSLGSLQSKINLAKDVSTALTAALPSLDSNSKSLVDFRIIVASAPSSRLFDVPKDIFPLDTIATVPVIKSAWLPDMILTLLALIVDV